jgi:hypothetical protein
VLLCVEDFMHQETTARMQRLIEANQEICLTFSKQAAGKAGRRGKD